MEDPSEKAGLLGRDPWVFDAVGSGEGRWGREDLEEFGGFWVDNCQAGTGNTGMEAPACVRLLRESSGKEEDE